MNRETSEGPSEETINVAPITLKRVLTSVVNRFIETPPYKVGDENVYYQPENAIDDELERLMAEKDGLDHMQIFFHFVESTTITPHRLVETEAFGDLIEATDRWENVSERLERLKEADEKFDSEAVYRNINRTLLLMELEEKDNFSSIEQRTKYDNEVRKRNYEDD